MRSGRIRLMMLGVLAATLTTAAETPADPVAVLVKLNGAVQVQRSGAAAPVPAEVGMPLEPGDRVLPSAGARAVLLHSTGRTEVAATAVTVEAARQGERAGVFTRAVRTLESVAATSAKADPNRQGMIRPLPGAPVPVSPRNGIAILEARPTFVWLSVPGATGYMIQIRAEGQRPVRYEVGSDTTWALPSDAPPLVPGTSYQWTVGAMSSSARVAEPQEFSVATDSVGTAIQGYLTELEALSLDPDEDGAFLAAVIYHASGLVYEADRLLARLQATGDGEGRTFHLLRGEVYDALGRLDDAAREFALADAAAS